MNQMNGEISLLEDGDLLKFVYKYGILKKILNYELSHIKNILIFSYQKRSFVDIIIV
jgi:hypothetical protein